MVRPPSVHDEEKLKKGPWTPDEDQKLVECIKKHGQASWRAVPKLAGLNRCGKSCRLRWKNYLHPDIRRGKFSDEEEKLIINLHSVLGNKWSKIASHLPRRTDNEIKNFWNTNISKKLLQMGIDPKTHKPKAYLNHLSNLSQFLIPSQFCNFMINPLDLFKLQTNATQLANFHVLQNLLQVLNTTALPSLDYNRNSNIGSHDFCLNSLCPTFINPKLPTNLEEIVGLPVFNNGGFDLQGVAADNNDNVVNTNLHCFDHVNSEAEKFDVPKLLSTLPSPEISSVANNLETNNNISNATTPAHSSTMFEDWERLLLNEGTTESYWNEFLPNDFLT